MTAKTGLFAVAAAAAIVTFAAGAIPQSKARLAGATGQVDTFKMMTTGKQLPSEHFALFLRVQLRAPAEFSAGHPTNEKVELAPLGAFTRGCDYSARVISKPPASTGAAGIGCTARGDITCNPRT